MLWWNGDGEVNSWSIHYINDPFRINVAHSNRDGYMSCYNLDEPFEYDDITAKLIIKSQCYEN